MADQGSRDRRTRRFGDQAQMLVDEMQGSLHSIVADENDVINNTFMGKLTLRQ